MSYIHVHVCECPGRYVEMDNLNIYIVEGIALGGLQEKMKRKEEGFHTENENFITMK